MSYFNIGFAMKNSLFLIAIGELYMLETYGSLETLVTKYQ